MKDEQNKNINENPLQTYNEYQSKYNQQFIYNTKDNIQINSDKNIQRDQLSQVQQYKSTKIGKSSTVSAVDLLNEIIGKQNTKQWNKNKQKTYIAPANTIPISSSFAFSQQFNTSSIIQPNPHNVSNKNNKSNVNFNEFQLWTSTISSKNGDKFNQRSNKQQKRPSQSLQNSPKNKNDKKNVQYYYNLQYPQQSRQRTYYRQPPQYQQQPHQQQDTFDIFESEIKQSRIKKSESYLKKQPSNMIKNEKSSIRIKQIKQYRQTASNQPRSGKQRGKSANNRIKNIENYQDNFQEYINCYKSNVRQQLNDRNLTVVIDNHQIIQRKFLAADYAMYSVKIIPLEIQCKRNYQDFQKLKKTLIKYFPGYCIPYLQKKNWLTNKINIDYINNQKKMLQYFLKDLIRNTQLKNSRVMEDFLTIKQHKKIKRKFQNYQKMQSLKSFSQMCLLDGKVHVTLNQSQKIYVQNFQKFMYKMGQLYTKQQKLIQSIIVQYNQIINTYKTLISSIEQIQKQIKDFNTKVNTNVIKYLGQVMRIVKQTYKQQYSNIKFQNDINTKKILPFFKYERKNFLQLTHLINLQKKIKKSYDRRTLTQKIGVGQTYVSQSLKIPKKSVLQENSSLLVHKYQVAYLGERIRNQGQRVFDELGVKTFKRFQTLGQSYLNKIKSSIEFWQNLMRVDKQKFRTELTY